jgi:hypothetical protein
MFARVWNFYENFGLVSGAATAMTAIAAKLGRRLDLSKSQAENSR